MNEQYQKTRYIYGKGCSLSHTVGMSAEKSTLSYLHHAKDCIILYFIKGSGNVKIEGKKYTIAEGDVILINPSELFMCEIYSNTHHERLVLRVNHSIMENFSQDGSSMLLPLYKRENGSKNHIPHDLVESIGAQKYMEEIFKYAKCSSPSQKILAVCKTIELLNVVSEYLSSNKKPASAVSNNLINDVVNFINAHFHENVSVESIASEFHIDKSYLSHLFKEYVGIPLWNYVICKRVNYFNDLVIQNRSIEEAYVLAGFQNYSNFFRLYKKHMNMTPSEFQRTYKTRP